MLTVHSSTPTLQQTVGNVRKSDGHRPRRVLEPKKGPTVVQAQSQGVGILDCVSVLLNMQTHLPDHSSHLLRHLSLYTTARLKMQVLQQLRNVREDV